ncbi:hypothetical protein Tsubulata_028293 [Turnera subulata]|uniref:Pentacotripeptide-repeat region of PRORP domain-containing protein n=1 Tax=Turnera subulata TaxID=218843 RepID=A0A9Q0FT28_9ROSI|nr:hypothetical protein Tsubulata_028293 [Turnera subulata]
MKRVIRIAEVVAQQELLCSFKNPAKTLTSSTSPLFTLLRSPNYPFSSRDYCAHPTSATPAPPPSPSSFLSAAIGLFIDKLSSEAVEEKEDLAKTVADQLIEKSGDLDAVVGVLEGNGKLLFSTYSDGSGFIELLHHLTSRPHLALEVFNWRRKQSENSFPMTVEEYSKGIMVAGRNKNVETAINLFEEACTKNLEATSTYNALLGAFVYNGLLDKCLALFEDLKKHPSCSPSIVTYNILISAYGRLSLLDHMEAAFREVEGSNLSANLTTYNNLISGYLTAWAWDHMDKTFQRLKAGPVKADLHTHLLMLRGYAHAGNLEKMEEIYELVKDHVNQNELPLIRAMICAYCKSSVADRVEKIEALMKHIPDGDYRPWLNVLLIKLYAQEDNIERMEDSINEAFDHKTSVTTVTVMKIIISAYYRYKAVDRLANFIRRAEDAGWRICRSLYHCKMLMYGEENRLEEMEAVLHEMEKLKLRPCKSTLWILYKAYENWDDRHKVQLIAGLMCKHGYGIPFKLSSS